MPSLDDRWLRAAATELGKNLTDLLATQLQSDKPLAILAWTKFFAGEVDLSSFIGDHLERGVVYLPRTLPNRSMDFISVGRNWGEEVEAGMYGIPEPGARSGEPFVANPDLSTIVLVPGLAFDSHGNRLGRGKGYYDRFLAKPEMKHAIKIGICWSLQIIENLPVEHHDVPMDWICHERGYQRIGLQQDLEAATK